MSLDEAEVAQQLRVFGFAHLRGAAADTVEELQRAFGRLIDLPADGAPNERVTRFDALNEMPELGLISGSAWVGAICGAFFERNHQVITSDANALVGDSYWHSDGFYTTPFLRFALYLDTTAHDTGALRFLPGSHRADNGWLGEPTQHVIRHREDLGLTGGDVPAVVVESQPGDAIVFDTNVLHSAWHGGIRRQLAFNCVGDPVTETEQRDTRRYFLNRYVSGSVSIG
ncbi:phytanoyl-CoA dioxygenase family protein [Streptomyces sp. NBC_00091]|uniref:phytanoyl-CoA dioxygenase family protein n=1 Tax=Streptomyces sp. NBC_00091 TaxID=2975648 RepID=UPI00224E707D|nr:phytanoyl-CoA dioxygenase family protein [Streptomyces sp. NBC_00091]MCX5380154.1 phytanoyl-CoA dioxygenase family protein [Streptomyces sp. NBC_00091]